MRIFLAGVDTFLDSAITEKEVGNNEVYCLESFYSLKRTPKYLHLYKDFLLDSGAFSFFGSKKNPKDINWNEYVQSYIDFINKYDIKHFFELDVDMLLGYDTVLEIRKNIEKQTGKKSIPVFHRSRGIEEYRKMCGEYDYVAIGCSGKHDSVWTRKRPEILYKLVIDAKKQGVKVHGLGYTSDVGMRKIPFYSVDSTSWLQGNKFGSIMVFNGSGLDKIIKKPGTRLRDAYDVARNNFLEWKKYQHYMDLTYRW